MLNTCEVYVKDYNILFNAKKSKLMYFGRNNINTNNMMSANYILIYINYIIIS